MSQPHPQFVRKFFRDHIEVIGLTLFIAVAIRFFVIGAYRVPNTAMLPTLKSGDFVFGLRLPYGVRIPILGSKIPTHHLPPRGSLIVFNLRDQQMETATLLKRVIGLPGDQITIDNGRVLVNGQALTYSAGSSTDALVLPQGFSRMYEHAGEKSYEVILPNTQEPAMAPVLVPANAVYVLGDDRSTSDDSRQFGPFPADDVEAQAFLVWLSLDWPNAGPPSIRWDRVLKKID